MSTKIIKLDSPVQRILLIVFAIGSLILVFFAAKWFLGNSISSRVIQTEVADLAITLAPDDPQTHFAKGVLFEQSFQSDDLPKSLTEYEKAVALSPYDYRLWVAYGKAKERNGDAAGAEKALLKALELAPNYAEVQWTYGNILLRQNKTNEAFTAMRKAVEGDSKFAAPAATTAWDIFDGDLEKVKNAIGDSSPVKSALATFLAGQKRFVDSLDVWNKLPENERKTTFRKDGENIINQLISNNKYRSAVPLKSMLADPKNTEINVGKVTDGGFEGIITAEDPDIFEWKIADGNKPVLGLNVEQKHAGEKSLAIIFNSPRGNDFREISQVIAVESSENYEFEIFYKSNLESNATVKWEIIDIVSGNVLASTDAVAEKSDWKSLSAKFKTTEAIEGVKIRLVRQICDSSDCSIKGTVWFDDASLN